MNSDKNFDNRVIEGFGREWEAFSYASEEAKSGLDSQFHAYSYLVDFDVFDPMTSTAADFGAGSGRWTSYLLRKFKKVWAIEPSDGAFKVLQEKFSSQENVIPIKETVGENSIPNESLDFAMSLGVLHHIPNTKLSLIQIADKLKPGGTLLCYLYYKLDDKPLHYRFIFQIANFFRLRVSKLPYAVKYHICSSIAYLIYFPFARISKKLNALGWNVTNIPLHHYMNMPLYMMRNDALDRFGTTLEQRFSKLEIFEMLQNSNFAVETLKFSAIEPFWTFTVRKNNF